MRIKNLFCTLVLSYFAYVALAQEQLGLRLENFAGINSVFINPAASQSTPFRWDINLASAGVFIENEYAFVRDASISDLLSQRDNLEFVSAHNLTNDTNLSPSTYIVDYTDNGNPLEASILTTINGPSAMVKFGQHTIGAFYNYRSAFSAPNIPETLSFYTYFNRQFLLDFPVAPFDGAFMIWDELGVNYAYHIETSDGFFTIGANLKYLRGKEAFYFENENTIDLAKVNSDSIRTALATLNYGLTTASIEEQNFANKNTGSGFAMDIGVSATFGGYEDEGYDLKIGASLLDIGVINFNTDAQAHRAEITQLVDISGDEFAGAQGIEDYNEFLQTFSEITTGSPTQSLQSNSFAMALPSALSLQADYSFTKNVFLNALVIQRLRLNKPGIARNNTIAVSPRFEHRWFAFQMPFILNNYSDFRVGLSARLAFIVIGSDNIGSLIGRQSQFSGTDLYAGIKINPFSVGTGSKSTSSRRFGNNKKVKCYF